MRHAPLAVVLLASACADGHRPDPAPTAPPGPAAQVGITFSGHAWNDDKRARCEEQLHRQHVVNDLNSPVQILLQLDPGLNRMQVSTRARGIVRMGDLPGWDVGRICREAAQAGMQALAQEPPPPGYAPGPAPTAPPPGYAPAPQQPAPQQPAPQQPAPAR